MGSYQFPSAITRYLVSNGDNSCCRCLKSILFPSAITRYLVSNFPPYYEGREPDKVSIRYNAVLGFQRLNQWPLLASVRFPSAITRYLVSNYQRAADHQGTGGISIRYNAVLGFQPYQKNTPSDQRRRKRFTHPPSNRSHSHICFLKSR